MIAKRLTVIGSDHDKRVSASGALAKFRDELTDMF
jgi:hypothetical protein